VTKEATLFTATAARPPDGGPGDRPHDRGPNGAPAAAVAGTGPAPAEL